MKMRKGRHIWHMFAFIGVFAAAIAVIMLLWNALIPTIIGWAAINYWQAAGLLILCKLLFGGFKHFGHGWHHHGKRHGAFHEKLKRMSPDERREYLLNRMNKMHSCDEHFAADKANDE